MSAREYSDVKLYGRLLDQARPYGPHIGTYLLLCLLSTPTALLFPLPLKVVVDSVFGSHPLPGFLQVFISDRTIASSGGVLMLAAGLVVAVALLDQFQKVVTSILGTYTTEKLILSFRTQLFRHGQRLSLAYHDAKGTADAVYRIHSDAAAIPWILVYGIVPLLSAGFMLVGMIYVTMCINWHLALVALAVCPVIFLATWTARRRLRRGWETAKALESTAYSVLQEVLTGLRLVKVFGQEDREGDRFADRSLAGMRARIRMAFLEGTFGSVIAMATAVGTAVVLYFGGRHVQAGRLTPGDLILVMGYLALLYGPLQTITKCITTMQSSMAGAARAFALLDEKPDVEERPDARPLARAVGDIIFRDVSFSYGGREPAVRDISFHAPAGTRVGIAGPTGAGKSTLISLLARFYDPTAGQVLLDGIDVRKYRLADLRKQFAIVLQDTILFSATVGENIAYARPEATEAEIVAAARAANAHDFISALPEGYRTLVGERGMRLSGGERQRIALARAFLKNAPILILDEPTSALDNKTEAGIMEAMDQLMRGRTTLMIAHRLSTLAKCDIRLEIEHGRMRRDSSQEAVAVSEPVS